MRTLNSSFGLFIALTLSCCQSYKSSDDVAFTEPQPAQIKSLSAFPKKLKGEYQNPSDSTFLTVTETGIFWRHNSENKTHVKDLDSTVALIGDSLLRDKKSAIEMSVTRFGDSLTLHEPADTLFSIQPKHVLKEYKGSYFLNKLSGEGWLVYKLDLKKNCVMLSQISVEKDLEKLKAVSQSQQDSVPYMFTSTRKQFQKFIQDKGFSLTDTFIRRK